MDYHQITSFVRDKTMGRLEEVAQDLQVSEHALIQIALDQVILQHKLACKEKSLRWTLFQYAQTEEENLQRYVPQLRS